ncbi:MAG: wall-associated protein, partial [Oscillospiraceae bacterium]|nr:wall-associated protein [Oscillospiraceae bacterium]
MTYANHNGKTYSYMYDKGGNILSKTENGVTKTYSYGDSTWKDLLTAYNGNAITYDTIGNPLTYYDGKTFDWDGRQLKSVGTGTTYKYNADGIRTQKIQGSNVTQYYLNGSQILASKDNFGWIYYDYDATGK